MSRPPSLFALPSYLASQAAKNAHRRLVRPLADHSLTLTHYAVLCALGDLGTRSQGEIAASLDIDKSHVTAVVDQLVGAGLAERERDDGDRRRYRVSATTHGRRLLAELASVVEDSQRAFRTLTADEQALLCGLLAKVVAAEDDARLDADAIGAAGRG
jgi:DNA-binding MarR family transcriptional regulator